ncbi:hypothetical protein GQ55_1G334700 [Panicum hallii var. hallii]|uniref:Uncharacterized protein n=1 Tax=Panicum hallii var. hallii TaxID=1504633 RepID=A0A2T7FA81_9POAL|nr:hypothetical protein GQ55_1G334700 [Panicum hallii var. hallii]
MNRACTQPCTVQWNNGLNGSASFRTNASSCSSTERQISSATEGAPGGGKCATISAGTSATNTREVVIPSAPIAAARTAGHGAPMEPNECPVGKARAPRLPTLPKSCRSTGAWAPRCVLGAGVATSRPGHGQC